ncbi:hypothetical protein B566_EDAN006272 [Ephemera danica]|nr:hypothetical protein B566_EDAN006272 [Ephemera danica]
MLCVVSRQDGSQRERGGGVTPAMGGASDEIYHQHQARGAETKSIYRSSSSSGISRTEAARGQIEPHAFNLAIGGSANSYQKEPCEFSVIIVGTRITKQNA